MNSKAKGVYEKVSRDWSPDLKGRIRAGDFHYSETIGSTNDQLIALAKKEETRPFTLCLTDHQTSGRGRRGDAWIAPAGRNLLFSLLFDLDLSPEHWSRVPHIVAWSVGRAFESLIGGDVKIATKWPNDLYCNGRKLAGILVETNLRPEPRAVVGIGINVNMRHEEFPVDLRETAISLYEILGCESSRWYLLTLVLENLVKDYPRSIEPFDRCLHWLSERDYLRGRKLEIDSGGKKMFGRGAGVAPDGSLLLERENGDVTYIVSCETLLFC